MGSHKKISVVLPVYNVEEYLKECLNSIVNQTLKDIEIICINDGSTDNSLKILEEYAKDDNRIVIINQENQGQGCARNKGIDIATGEYIAFVDPDDYIELNTFEIIYNKFKETGVNIIHFDFQTLKKDNKHNRIQKFSDYVKKYCNFSLKNNAVFKWSDFAKIQFSKLPMCVWNKVYSTQFLKENKIKMGNGKFGEDVIFSFKSCILADNIFYLSLPLYHYRARTNSALNKPIDDVYSAFENLKDIKDFLVEQDIYSEYKSAFRIANIDYLAQIYTNIPQNVENDYINQCKQLLSSEDFKQFLKETEPKLNLLQRIFSIKNWKTNGIKKKYLHILGLKFCIQKKELCN